jgi:hypothetical protein
VTLGYSDSGMAGEASNDRAETFAVALSSAAQRIVDVLAEAPPR